MITKDIKYVGVNDKSLDLFEGQYKVPNGMAYNSYVILDNEIAVLDTVDARFGKEWLEKLESVLSNREPSYLIVQHVEPDHSSNIVQFMEKYKNAKIVATDKSFTMIKQFYGSDYLDRRVVVKERDTLSLGKHTLTFITAPMVHWPEVMVSYDNYDGVLFSADAFGKFGSLDTEEEWACEARRYYFGIVGKYGMQASALLKKVEGLDIKIICPLHGPVLNSNLDYYLNLYKIWTSYSVESDGVAIFYTSVYGNTKKAVELLQKELSENGTRVVVSDLARCDLAEAVEDAFRYGKIVLATTTYNNEIFPFMRDFISELVERNYQNRYVAIIENGSWAPVACKKIKASFDTLKNITYLDNNVTIRSSLSEENKKQLKALATELSNC